MSELSSSPKQSGRRQSFMDYGGANSLHNFASSFQRASMYMGAVSPDSHVRYDLSPYTSADNQLQQDLEPGQQSALIDDSLERPSPGALLIPKKSNDLNHFHFPGQDPSPSESSALIQHGGRSASSNIMQSMASSTAPQTTFNAVNTLMGIAMLSLPFGLRLSGWICGIALLVSYAWITSSTAKVLGRILKKHKTLHTYADIAYSYGGSSFHAFATVTFTIDLIGASLSLVLIFSDSFTTLFPSSSPVMVKAALLGLTLALSFLPLSMVSFVSLVGVLCTVGIMVVIVLCGFTSASTPGSLIHSMPTSIWPSSLTDLLFSLGIFMSPWGGHPVFPELYRDMRHPAKFSSCCNVTFLCTAFLDVLIATVGYLMYGAQAQDSLTKNIIANANYADWVRPLISLFLGLLPVCKLALITRPVISVYEAQLSIASRSTTSLSPARVGSRCAFMAFLLALSIAFTSFGKVVAFLGSAICFTICVTLPLLFHLRFNADELTPWSSFVTKGGIVFGILGALLGTYGSAVSQTV